VALQHRQMALWAKLKRLLATNFSCYCNQHVSCCNETERLFCQQTNPTLEWHNVCVCVCARARARVCVCVRAVTKHRNNVIAVLLYTGHCLFCQICMMYKTFQELTCTAIYGACVSSCSLCLPIIVS
jgi:hypothetical protein